MTDDAVNTLLQHNRDHFETLPDDHFSDVQGGQEPHMVSICCSDSRVSQEGMFDVDQPGELFTPSNIGNQAWDVVNGEKTVNGSLLYPVTHTGTRTIAIVGHTGCGAITAAYQHVTEGLEEPPGVQKYVDLLEPVVAEAIELNIVDTDSDTVIEQLVEYNVDEQVRFLQDSDLILDDVDIYGFVYDFQGVYGDDHGKLYLVNVNGDRDPDALKDAVADDLTDHVQRLTEY